MYNNKPLEELTVFQFHFFDDIKDYKAVDDLPMPSDEKIALIEQLEEAFKKAGWEGDGEIRICWIPPFLYNVEPDDEDPGQIYGVEMYLVKQYNNGTTFIAVEPEGLNFISKTSLLAQQNPRILGLEE